MTKKIVFPVAIIVIHNIMIGLHGMEFAFNKIIYFLISCLFSAFVFVGCDKDI